MADAIFKPNNSADVQNGSLIVGLAGGSYLAEHSDIVTVSVSGEMNLSERFDDPDYFVEVL